MFCWSNEFFKKKELSNEPPWGNDEPLSLSNPPLAPTALKQLQNQSVMYRCKQLCPLLDV